MITYYYLHTNGALIHKRFRPDPSDFVVKIWEINTEYREHVWQLLIEARALGASNKRIEELAKCWGCTNEDGKIFCKKMGLKLIECVDQFCVTYEDFKNLQESPSGFGYIVLAALAALSKETIKS